MRIEFKWEAADIELKLEKKTHWSEYPFPLDPNKDI